MSDVEQAGSTSDSDHPATETAAVVEGTGAPRRRLSGRAKLWIAVGSVAGLLVLGALAWLIAWSLSGGGSASDPSQYEAAWRSALKKAGTTAEWPGGPVPLDQVEATGSHPFEARFTAAEITALLNVFTRDATVQGTPIALRKATITFPAQDTVRLDGNVIVDGNSFGAVVDAPATYANGQVQSSGITSARSMGVSADEKTRAMATTALLEYVNEYLAAAPGLVVESARIVPGGVVVSGTAPDALKLPTAPTP